MSHGLNHRLNTWARTRSALGAQVKAIQLCDQKGWSLAAPLLGFIEGLTATGEGFLSGDPSLVEFFFCELSSSEVGEHLYFSCKIPSCLCRSLCCYIPALPFHHVNLSDCNSYTTPARSRSLQADSSMHCCRQSQRSWQLFLPSLPSPCSHCVSRKSS